MRVSRHFLFLLLSLILLDVVLARGGGGKGGRGRGRGRSGVRGGGSRPRPQMKSSIKGSSSMSNGVRSGTFGIKLGSQTSRFSNYGSKAFLEKGFSHHPNILIRAGHPFVVIAAFQPIFYDNRNYYWSYTVAKTNHNDTSKQIMCEYQFGEDDGDLQHVTFSNGTEVKSIFFTCNPYSEKCCGMYCCYDFDSWFEMFFLLGFIIGMVFMAYKAKRRELATYQGQDDKSPLREKSPANKSTARRPSTNPQNKKPQPKKTQGKAWWSTNDGSQASDINLLILSN